MPAVAESMSNLLAAPATLVSGDVFVPDRPLVVGFQASAVGLVLRLAKRRIARRIVAVLFIIISIFGHYLLECT